MNEIAAAPSCQSTNFLFIYFFPRLSGRDTLPRSSILLPFFCFVNYFLYLFLVYGPPTTLASPSTHVSLTSLVLVRQVLFVTLRSSCVSPHFSLLFFILLCTILKRAFELTALQSVKYSLNICRTFKPAIISCHLTSYFRKCDRLLVKLDNQVKSSFFVKQI